MENHGRINSNICGQFYGIISLILLVPFSLHMGSRLMYVMMVFAPLASSSFSIKKEEEGALCAQRFRKFDLAWGSSERRSSLFSQHFLELTGSKQGARTRKFPPFRPLFNDDDVGKKPLFRQFSRLHIQFNDSTKLEFSHSLTHKVTWLIL